MGADGLAEGSMVPVPQGGGIDINDSVLDKLIDKAQARPRDIVNFAHNVEVMALRDDRTAGECLYGLPRAGKVIEGPSVRLAEMLVLVYGNYMVNVEAMPIMPGDTDCTSVATGVDLEKLTIIRIATKRRITKSGGERYNEDMLVMTQNANNAVVFRNVVFKQIPQALWYGVYEKARVKALGEGGTIPQKRQEMIAWFGKLGIQTADILKRLKVESTNDIGIDQLVTLKGLGNAIKSGEIDAQQAFYTGSPMEGPGGAEGLQAQIDAQPGKKSDRDIAKEAVKRKQAAAETPPAQEPAGAENGAESTGEPPSGAETEEAPGQASFDAKMDAETAAGGADQPQETGDPVINGQQAGGLLKFAGQFGVDAPLLVAHIREVYNKDAKELTESEYVAVRQWAQEPK